MADVPVPVINRRAAHIRWAANAGYALVLIVLAVVPSSVVSKHISTPDWLSHAIAYGVQSALLFWALAPAIGRRRGLIVAFAGAVAFGAITEGLQFLQPGRAVELKDVLANSVGALAVCSAVSLLTRGSAGAAG